MISSQISDCSISGRPALVSGDLVMGLRWDRRDASPAQNPRHADLDAACVLFDSRGTPVEVVHPRVTRNGDGSVVHTGDSSTGAGPWDDERIFVFLDALPEHISTLAFGVRSGSARGLGDAGSPSCHLSDATTECVYLHVDLEPYKYAVARCIAVLFRQPAGWSILHRAEAGLLAVAVETLLMGLEEET